MARLMEKAADAKEEADLDIDAVSRIADRQRGRSRSISGDAGVAPQKEIRVPEAQIAEVAIANQGLTSLLGDAYEGTQEGEASPDPIRAKAVARRAAPADSAAKLAPGKTIAAPQGKGWGPAGWSSSGDVEAAPVPVQDDPNGANQFTVQVNTGSGDPVQVLAEQLRAERDRVDLATSKRDTMAAELAKAPRPTPHAPRSTPRPRPARRLAARRRSRFTPARAAEPPSGRRCAEHGSLRPAGARGPRCGVGDDQRQERGDRPPREGGRAVGAHRRAARGPVSRRRGAPPPAPPPPAPCPARHSLHPKPRRPADRESRSCPC